MELPSLLLLIIPIVGSLLTLLLSKRQDEYSSSDTGNGLPKTLAFIFSLASLAVAVYILANFVPDASSQFVVNYNWIYSMGINFKLGIDGISLPFVLLTNGLIPLIILASFKHNYRNAGSFYSLVLFMQAGLLLVFTAKDAFLFYVGWEAALIPIYFICGLWGGENRVPVTIKFFIYTMLGSLIMLIAIIYLYTQTPQKTFDIDAFYQLQLHGYEQSWIFLAFFLAFAIKIPIFPFHTWQPDTYTEAPTAGTMLLSGIMLKMGIYGAIRWLVPVAPLGFVRWGDTVVILSIIGIVYASIIAFTQRDVKRLIAYSSIAHVGLIAAGIFAWNVQSLQGAMLQMLNHGLDAVGLFFIADIIIRRLNHRDINNMGGIAKTAPKFAIGFLIILLGSVALPLTNGFVGEFLLLLGISSTYNVYTVAIAGLSVIFGAVYMLRMYQKVMLGSREGNTLIFTDITGVEYLVIGIICFFVIAIGIFPNPVLHLSEASVKNLIEVVQNKIQTIGFTY
ncbi:MAG: NADH-quinone oxidoreductase subunit [Sphingobacteriaceae bacterium]|jgi:NADH-quinone oxidoreductase subunit M|nr:NADH-quinone oxidoreductase subunit [Sphingobacteriaceae bacterium]